MHSADSPAPARIGVVIRFKNSAATLPRVLESLARQTLQPDLLIGVDSGSTDGSARLIREAGGVVIPWTAPYHHARVLNFALAQCPAERVLILSSHTALDAPTALAQLDGALDDPRTACASATWDDDPYYSAAIDWPELQAKGLRLGSIYTNSLGMIRRSLWQESPFDEKIPTMEDYAWAIEQIRRGFVCRRIKFAFHYLRAGPRRDFAFTYCAFHLASRYKLAVRWLGRRLSLTYWLKSALRLRAVDEVRHGERLLASFLWPLPISVLKYFKV